MTGWGNQGERSRAEVLGTCFPLIFQRPRILLLALPAPNPLCAWWGGSHFRSWGYVVSCSPLLPKSEDRENRLQGCYGNQSPWRARSPQTLSFQACSDLKRKCFIRYGDEDDHMHIYRDTCLHVPTFTLSWALLLSPDSQE